MRSYEEATAPLENEITRHAIRYALFLFLSLSALWFVYSLNTSYQKDRAYLEEVTPGEDGCIIVDNSKWVQYSPPPEDGIAIFYEPEDHPILIHDDKGDTYEKWPDGGLYLKGQQVTWMGSSPNYYLIAKDPNVKVRVMINRRRMD